MPDNSRRRTLKLVAALAIVSALLITGCWPVTTAVGVNYQVTQHRLTLFEKAVAFVDRDLAMRRLTRDIAGSEPTPERRLLRMFEWVTENIHPVPPGLPVVDDHVLYIFVRGYGADDQRAEALAALASYDGMPASQVALGKDPKRRLVQLTVVKLGDRLVVLDANNRLVFRKSSGELATLDDLKADRSIIRTTGAGVIVDGAPYHEHFQRIGEITPSYWRMEDQRLWPRLKNEVVGILHGR